MSYAAPYDESVSVVEEQTAELLFIPRSRHQWVPLLFPVLLSGISSLGGGLPLLTDFAFLILTSVCAFFLVHEFVFFSHRFGIGGILLYGGVLVWFCHDYFSNWFLRDFTDPTCPFPPYVIAKTAFYHSLFILFMSIGLRIPGGRWLQRAILAVPEPGSETFYLVVMLLALAVGLSPLFLFVDEPWYLAVFHTAFASWTGAAKFNVFRTGNLNYSWGGYVAQILQAGQVGGIFASLFAILISRRLWSKILGWTIWIFWTLSSFNTGRRGELAFMVLPPIAFLFVKYQSLAAISGLRSRSIRAYVVCGIFAIVLLFFVQLQGSFRSTGLSDADFSQVELTKSQGNTMFSEGLLAWQTIPDQRPFFRNNWPLEGLIRPLPEQVFWFVIGPIPRALWHDKPVDELWSWYNEAYLGMGNGVSGTTIAHGLVGSWYFNYGFWGVLEGGLLVGWLMGVTERALQHSEGRPMGIMMSLGVAVWLFRIYRDFIFIELYGLLIGGVVLSVLVYAFRPFLGGTTAARGFSPVLDQGQQSGYGV